MEIVDEARDRRMAAVLEEARLQLGAGARGGSFDNAGASARYAAAFREYGVDVEALAPDEAAALIRRSAIRGELTAGLIEWADAAAEGAPEAEAGRKLLGVIRAVDPDPHGLLGRWKGAFADYLAGVKEYQRRRDAGLPEGEWKPARDEAERRRDALLRLAAEADLDALPASTQRLVGRDLGSLGAADEAVAWLRAACERHPDDFLINSELAYQLSQQQPPPLDEVIRYYTAALAVRPPSPAVHNNLAVALEEAGRTDEAAAEFRKVLALQPDDARAQSGLGRALWRQGRFADARAALRRGLELAGGDAARAGQPPDQLRTVEQLADLDALLPTVLAGRAAPADAAGALRLADLCGTYREQYAAAAALYAAAFAAPGLPDDARVNYRYPAAGTAALAGLGYGEDAADLDAAGRAACRRQAREWLRADLARWAGQVERGDRAPALAALRRWRAEPSLAGVREPDRLAALPADERDAWRALWADVDALMGKAAKAARPGP
jgi:Flp pilus assembly protein TadD